MTQPLMPKATAVWLVDNTSLTFDQIGDFCRLHPLEVKGIADGDVAQGIKGFDPVASGQLTREQIEKAQENADYKLELVEPVHDVPEQPRRSGKRYTPLSRRQDRPDAIYWMIRNHPEISDAQIAKLIGTTKPTIQSIRDRNHWNSANLKPIDPVTLALCTQIELDEVVQKAAIKKARAEEKEGGKKTARAGTLKPTEETLAPATDIPAPAEIIELPPAEIISQPSEPASKDTFVFTASSSSNTQSETEVVTADDKDSGKEKTYDADTVFAGLDKKLKEARKKKGPDDEA